ncbi:MAG: hypothetical protein HYY77_10780 [Betaproteobacteria bacterium]|nr:hypothetical protein [Betaproteobacteria bacterium]
MRSRLSTWLLSIVVTVFAASGVTAAPALPTQTSSQSGVTVKITPRTLATSTWEFEVVFDTHSQELTDDLEKTAVLVSDARASHSPLQWQGDPPGGHHRKGVVQFKPVSPMPASIELQIKRSGETAPRLFRWQLK